MRHFAVVGSGPAGFYTAEALSKAYGDTARIDILDRYPVPYGLIRFGVAPDHQSLKAVTKRYDKVADEPGVDFIGNVTVGQDVSVAELLELYDAVILATGAPHDRKLGIPGEDLPGVDRLGRVRRLVQWPSRIRRPRAAARRQPRGGDRQRQCRARLRADPRQDARRVRGLGHRRPCARCARRVGDHHHHHPRPARAAPDRHDAQGTGRARPSRSRGPDHRSGRLPAGSRPTNRSNRACASRSACCAASPISSANKRQAHGVRLLRQAAADRGRRQGRAGHRRAHRARRKRRRARHRRDL